MVYAQLSSRSKSKYRRMRASKCIQVLEVDKSKFAATCVDAHARSWRTWSAQNRGADSKLQRLELRSKFGGEFTTLIKKKALK